MLLLVVDWMRNKSFSRSSLHRSWPALTTNWSPFCNGRPQMKQPKHGKWKASEEPALMTNSCGYNRSPQRPHLAPYTLSNPKSKWNNLWISFAISTRKSAKLCSLYRSIYLPVVVLATVDPAGTREARMNERGVTDAADQTVLVPGPVGYAHHVAVGDTQSASLAHFDPAQFEFDCRRNAGRRWCDDGRSIAASPAAGRTDWTGDASDASCSRCRWRTSSAGRLRTAAWRMIQTGLERWAGTVGVPVGAAAMMIVTGAVTAVATVTSAILQTLYISYYTSSVYDKCI